MAEMTWEQQGEAALNGLAPLRFLIGEWRGSGHCYGEVVNGLFSVKPLLDGSWLEATETMTNAQGERVHSDVSLYRYNVEAEHLQVLQLFNHGHQSSNPIELTDDGFRWITGPGAPQLRYTTSDNSFSYSVILSGEGAHSIEMTYKRA